MIDYLNPTILPGQNPRFGSSNQFDIPSTQTSFPFSQQRDETQGYLDSLSAFIPKQRGQIEGDLGLPLLRENFLRGNEMLNTLQSKIMGAPNMIADTSRESLMNEGQRTRAVEEAQAPMREDLGLLQGQQTNLGNALGLYETLAGQQEQQGLLPWEKQYDAMTRRQAAEITGWSEVNRNELDRLIRNQQAGLQWTEAEASRANQLALQEKQYKQALATSGASNPFVTIGEGNTLFNTATSKPVYRAPKTYAPTSGGGWF